MKARSPSARTNQVTRIVAILLPCLLITTHPCRRARAAESPQLEWNPSWPRVRPAEKLALVPVAGAAVTLAFVKPPAQPRWEGGILFDDWVRSQIRGRSLASQRTWGKISDYMYRGVAPLMLATDLAVALAIHENSDVTLQMLLIDLQSVGITGVLALAGERLVGRRRPYVQDCGPDHGIRTASGALLYNSCGTSNDNESFFAGHVAIATTAAGLTCIHHQHLPLYRGGLADAIPCAFMIGAAGMTGIGRLVADKHWASDVLLGWTVGAVSGYLTPALLHYGLSDAPPVGAIHLGSVSAVPLPLLFRDGGGIGLAGFL